MKGPDFVVPVGKCGDNFEGASLSDGEFGDSVVGGRAVYLDLGGNDIA